MINQTQTLETNAEALIKECRETGSKELCLFGCGIEELPADLAELKQLTILNISHNRLKTLPDFVGDLTSLEYLDLSHNQLTVLPECIGKLTRLGTLKLSENRLRALPESIEKIPLLETLSIDGNEIPNLDDCTSSRELTILDHMDKIVTLSEKNGLTEIFFKIAEPYLRFVSEKLKITSIQAVLFSQLLNQGNRTDIYFSHIAAKMHCNVIRNIQFRDDLEELEKRKFIRCRRKNSAADESLSFLVPLCVQESLRKHGEVIPIDHSNVNFDEFFFIIQDLYKERKNNEITYDALEFEIHALIEENMQLHFCKKIKNTCFSDSNKILFLLFCSKLVNTSDDEIYITEIKDIYDRYPFMFVESALKNGTHCLIIEQYIENYVNQDMFGNREVFKLTEKAKNEFLNEMDLKSRLKTNRKDILYMKNITEKILYYNEKEVGKIQRLKDLLREENFKSVQDTLSNKGLRKGFACFFFGPPGTGKTETVYQLARETGRDILVVDLSQTKSCWYGESEKKIKEIFEHYRNLEKKSELTPILLFNEADGVFGTRTEIGGINSSLQKTENTIQNIILEEMEKLSGILIATTNLTKNFDPAFERRFLYKIEFEKPDTAARKAIWRSSIPELSESDSSIIAERFDFSGGQIENIARKRTVDSIIYCREPDLNDLISLCEDEVLNKNATKKIGFGT
jgi:SpoVK/Ycf46/Vps4 family AAA+-type ATPase